jgi:hypothetical protein
VTSERLPVPEDRALPQMRELLDPDVMAEALGRSLAKGTGRPDVRVRYLRYRPQTKLVVQYDVAVAGGRHTATATTAPRDLSGRAHRSTNVAVAEMVDGRSPAARPLSYDPALRALIQWLPLDLSLPALAVSPASLRRRLRAAGVDVGADEGSLLAYRPGRQAVVRIDRHVLKYYSAPADFAQALVGLGMASALRTVRTTELEASLPELLLAVQRHVDGVPCASPAAAAVEAGEMLERVHAGALEGLPVLSPTLQLELAAVSAGLVAHITPELAPRLEALLRKLEATAPGAPEAVAAHGDFHSRQLIDTADGPVVTDFDSMWAAPAALDHATYCAHLVRGDPSDLDHALEVQEMLLRGYGRRPEELTWYLASMVTRRLAHPFRYQDEHWPARVERMLSAAEAVAR